MSKPECPECGDDEEYSVRTKTSSKTLMAGPSGVYDEEGNYHPPIDPNKIKTTYECSNGHTWLESRPADPSAEEKREKRQEAREKGLLPEDPW